MVKIKSLIYNNTIECPLMNTDETSNLENVHAVTWDNIYKTIRSWTYGTLGYNLCWHKLESVKNNKASDIQIDHWRYIYPALSFSSLSDFIPGRRPSFMFFIWTDLRPVGASSFQCGPPSSISTVRCVGLHRQPWFCILPLHFGYGFSSLH